MLSKVFERFVEKSPVSVMLRGLLERVFNPGALDELFNRTANKQYERKLLFSTIFELMLQVVCRTHPSIHAAYRAGVQEIGVSLAAVYDKLNGLEPEICAALVRYSAEQFSPVVKQVGGVLPPLVPGYRVKVLDGNCIRSTQHRIQELRGLSAAPLPGKSLVIYDPALKLLLDVFPCEDGHAQERSLFDQVLPTVEAGDLWIEDRNFCTVGFLFGIAEREAHFIVRQHGSLPWEAIGKRRTVGRVDTGTVYEQTVRLTQTNGQALILRRIELHLDEPTRDGTTEIFLLTNLPTRGPHPVGAQQIATVYRQRWTIERTFQELAEHLMSEINTLGYPRAALFGFCIALVCYNVMSAMQAALRAVHGAEKIEQEVSGYYIAEELASTYGGMMIAIPENEWEVFTRLTTDQLVQLLLMLAGKVYLPRFKKHPRGPKKPRPK